HPANDAVLSLHEIFGATGKMQQKWHILDEHEVVDGIDELGVLLYGHARNAYWYGSQLSIEETRSIPAYQDATVPPVSSARLAGARILPLARRPWGGRGKPRPPASSRRTRWASTAACKSSGPISARSRVFIPTGLRLPTGPACSRRISTPPIPGSSGTCSCGE